MQGQFCPSGVRSIAHGTTDLHPNKNNFFFIKIFSLEKQRYCSNGCLHGAPAKETLKSPPSGDTVRACPLGRVLVKMDILVPGKLMGTGEGKDNAAVSLRLCEMLDLVFVKPPAITVLSLRKDTATGAFLQSFSLLTTGLIK